jgi:SagB-type dehydrogenase family enzyme
VHRATRNTRAGAIGRALWPDGASARAGPRPGRERVALPPPGGQDGPPLAGVVQRFAPAARLSPGELPLQTLARLLHLANGITRPGRMPLRAAPSAGALYAGEVYVVAARVTGLDPGAYAFDAFGHELVRIPDGASLLALAAALEAPESIANAPACVLLTNVFARYTQRYANRGYRYALIDTGHIGENLRLAAAAEGLATCSPLRFHDGALNELLRIDGRAEAVCAVHAVGHAAAEAGRARRSALVEAQHAGGLRFDDDGLSEPERYHAATALVPGGAGGPAAVAERARCAARRATPPLPRHPASSCACSRTWWTGSSRGSTGICRTRTRWRRSPRVRRSPTTPAARAAVRSVRAAPPPASPCWPTSMALPLAGIAATAISSSKPAPSASASTSPPSRSASRRATSPPSTTTS